MISNSLSPGNAPESFDITNHMIQQYFFTSHVCFIFRQMRLMVPQTDGGQWRYDEAKLKT